jgi:hypothetical protein
MDICLLSLAITMGVFIFILLFFFFAMDSDWSVLFSFYADGYQETWIQWNGLSFRYVLLFVFHAQFDFARHGVVFSFSRFNQRLAG